MSVHDLIENRRDVLSLNRRRFSHSRVASLAGVRDTDSLIKRPLTNPRDLGAFIKSVPDLVARRSAVADHVLGQKDAYQYVLDNEASIRKTFGGDKEGAEHFNSIRDIAAGMKELDRAPTPNKVATHIIAKDPLERRIGTSIKSVFSQLRAAAQGRVSEEYVVSDIVGKAIFKVRQEQANKILQEAFYDPELAKALSETKDNSLKIHDKTAGLLKKRLVQMSLQSFLHTRDDPADDNVE